MAHFYFIRHGEHNFPPDALAGRTSGINLSPAGIEQARRTASHLQSEKFDRIYSSPLERTLETASIIAESQNLEVQICEALIEVNFGEWTQRKLIELEPLSQWKRFNAFRSGTRVPGGEHIIQIQQRLVLLLEDLNRNFPTSRIALVTHGDVIRTGLVYFLGMPIDFLLRFEISLASVSKIEMTDWGPKIHYVNKTF